MDDHYRLSLDSKLCRPRANFTRTLNNNIKGFSPRRRNRGKRSKPFSITFDLDMPVPGKMARRDHSPRRSPASDNKGNNLKPKRRYSRDELIELMTHPLSTKKHPCLEIPQNKSLVSTKAAARLLEERWNHRKNPDTSTDETKSDDPQKKRLSDSKAERLRKDQDVVLSPQRRSFNSGCFVNLPSQNNSNNRRPESPHKGDREHNHRELPARRIGSGRIMRDSVWDFRPSERDEMSNQSSNNHDFNFRQRDDRSESLSRKRPVNRRGLKRGQLRDLLPFDRRTYEKERPQQRNTRYNNDRRKSEKYEPEEPEWFSGGPTSQHDTIELHGFDGPEDEKSSTSKKQNKNNKNNLKNNRKMTDKSDNAGAKKVSSRKSSPEFTSQPKESSDKDGAKEVPSRKASPEVIIWLRQPTPNDEQQQLESVAEFQNAPTQETKAPEPEETKNQETDRVFDFEDILNLDPFPSILSISNGCVDEGGSGSRFSQFFRQNSPPEMSLQSESQNSSTQEMSTARMNGMMNRDITIPPDGGNAYFTPISPAASSGSEEQQAKLMEMIKRSNYVPQKGRKITKRPSMHDIEYSGKVHNVEELEARLRQGQVQEVAGRPINTEEDQAGFRKLMTPKPMPDNRQNSHPSMSGGFHAQKQPQVHHGMSQQQPKQMPIPHDLVLKLLQVQQQQRQHDVFAKLLAPPGRLGPSSQFSVPPPITPLSPELQRYVNSVQPSKELMQRPEAQNIIIGLKRGDISILHLMEQLKHSSALQPIHKEIIAAIIKLHNIHTGQREPSSANLVPPSSSDQFLHHLIQNQQNHHQHLRIPSPHPNAFRRRPVLSSKILPQISTNTLTIHHHHPALQRVPSPQELAAHTQNILQNALLKKKLEEQKENFRKRQELQRSHSPNVSVGGAGSLSPANQKSSTTSPTPLAFTPTSVLRKMTADKEGESGSKQLQLHDASQPSPKGRPILKGNKNFSLPPPPVPQCVNYVSVAPRINSTQHNNLPQTGGNSQHFMIGGNHMNVPPPAASSSASRGRNLRSSMMSQHQPQGIPQAMTQLLMNCQNRNGSRLQPDCPPMMRGPNYNLGYAEGANPPGNQLARWFSPELLAQARAGMLPNMPPGSPTQNMLSVEEIERLQQGT